MAHRGRPAIEDRPGRIIWPAADGQDRRQEATLRRERGVANRVDTPVNAVQPAAPSPRLHRVIADADRAQLGGRDDAVLAPGNLGQRKVGMAEFPVHMTDKSSSPKVLPPLGDFGVVRVLIADDHGIVRSGLRLLLERQPDIEVVAEAADGAEARELALRERPDLAILDVKMPKLTGLQATREIKAQAPEVAILILSMHDDERYLFEALKAGASGYVLKAQADTDLLAAVRAVDRGEPFLTPEAQRSLIKDVLERGTSGEEELTPREEEIVKLVAEAHTTKQIAAILHLSEKTVEHHRANAMRKLGMRDRVELVRYAIRRGLIEP
jgi:DNA-binding NarL/FixJ family response regulator